MASLNCTTSLLLLLTIFCISEASRYSNFRTKRAITADGLTGKKEMKLSDSEREAFDEFKAAVIHEIVNENMKTNNYLVKYLRAKDFQVPAAVAAFKATLAWRKKQDLDEDFLGGGVDYSVAVKRLLHGSTSELGVQNRTILFVQLGKWGLFQAIKDKEVNVYEHACYQIWEDAANKAIQNYEAGKSINAQHVMIGDFKYWTTREVVAEGSEGFDIWRRLGVTFGTHFPDFAHKIILVNTDEDFKLFYSLVEASLTADMRESIEIFGRKEFEWCPKVKKLVENHSQLKRYCSSF